MIEVKNFDLSEGLWWEETGAIAEGRVALDLVGSDIIRLKAYEEAMEFLVSLVGVSRANLAKRIWGGREFSDDYWLKNYGRYWVRLEDVTGLK